MASEFEIEPSGIPPDFDFESKDEAEQEYALLFIPALASLYSKYENKTPDFAIKNIDKDVAKLKTQMTGGVSQLEVIFDETASKILIGAGILTANVPKAVITPTSIKYGILEQRSTIDSITHQLKSGIKSKAYYLKNRGSEAIFNVASNFRTATNRLKKFIKSGVKQTIAKAEREAKVFLYGDPLSDWLTQGDGNVCKYCLAVEAASPMSLSSMPLGSLHPHCGGRCKILNHNDLDLELTKRAQDLTRYDLGIDSDVDFTI